MSSTSSPVLRPSLTGASKRRMTDRSRLRRLVGRIARLPGLLVRNGAYNARVVIHTLVLVALVALADICLMGALLVKLFSPKLGWSISCWTAGWFWGFMQRYFEESRNARPAIKVLGDPLPRGESAILLMNHLSYSDFYLTQHLAIPAGMLDKCRYFAKKELVWMIPLFGWAFWAMDMILVSRNWTEDEASIRNAFARLTRHKHKTWVGICPEGTRLSPSKLLASQAYSRQHGRPELQNLLWPRTRGFVATIKGMREHVEAVYDLSYVYITPPSDSSGNRAKSTSTTTMDQTAIVTHKRTRAPSLAELVGTADLAQAGYEFLIHVKRIPIDQLPTSDEDLKLWCEDRWIEKDRIISAMIADAVTQQE